jgi:Zn-dependent peptidase ImmA (M78 family)/transcriptional regulator with XRE-family HTH domain
MAASIPSKCNPRMVEWTRVKAGFTREAVAKLEKVSVATVEGWENGSHVLSLSKARQLAKRYHYPLMVFYLPSPPVDFTVVRDFRLLPDGSVASQSTELRNALRFAQERQAWAASYLEDTDASDKCQLIATAKLSEKPLLVSSRIRGSLGVSIETQIACKSESQAFNFWRERCELAGIFVFQTNGIPVAQMRGCALSDTYAPVAMVNGRDSYTAKVFTLAHELVHLALGLSAISGGPQYLAPSASKESVERFCNATAAGILIPQDDFIRRVPSNWKANDDRIVADLSRLYWVSRQVIGIRLVETGFADQKYLSRKWGLWSSGKAKKNAHAPPQFRRALARNGEAFVRLTLSAYQAGAIHGGQLSSLLQMRLHHLAALESSLYPTKINTSLSA